MTFSLSPFRVSILPCTDASVRTRVVSWNEAAEMKLRVCSDEDDQMFVDLALQARASALISRDRAVLRLARAAKALGLAIVVPERWQG